MTGHRCLSEAGARLLGLVWDPSVLELALPISWASAKALQRFEGQLLL